MRARRRLLLAAGVALAATLAVGAVRNGVLPASQAAAGYGAAIAALAVGLVAWRVRPDSRIGLYVAALALVGMLSDLNHVFRGSRPAVTVGLGASWLAGALLVAILLSYPSGRLSSRLDRAYVATAWIAAAAYGVAFMLFYSPRSPFDPSIWSCASCAVPYTHVAWFDLIGVDRGFGRGVFVFALVGLALLGRKLVRTSPGGRRVVLPLAVAGAFIVVEFSVQIAIYGEPVNSWTRPTWFWITQAAVFSVPVALALALLWEGGGRGAVARLVVELERTPPGAARDALARTLGDPTLELALRLPREHRYVDGAGRPIDLPEPGSGRAVTLLGPAGAPVAALVHDPVLLERRGLLAAVGAAAKLAVENERLQAELRAQLTELRESRARIVTVGDEERRRLERDLHDGAQQRLLSLGLALQLARAKLGPEANGASEILSEAECELQTALDELRELARGIHPAVLTEQGLEPALRSLAERSPVPVQIASLPRRRFTTTAEAAAYFLVSEALANVAKYARASHVRVSVVDVDGHVVVDVDDDGVGGADPARGSGLRGLADRVHALDGELTLDSLPGHGTHLHAAIPCA